MRTAPFACALAALASTAACGAEMPAGHVRVAAVLSGDTVTLADGRTVRLLGVDAPDNYDCHAYLSRWELGQLVPPGASVDVRVVARSPALGRVFRQGEDIGLELVRKGAAAPLFRGPPGSYEAQLLRAARAAQAARRGAWGGCATTLDPARPWHLERRRSPDRIFR